MYQNQSDLYKYPHFCEVDNVDNWVYTNAAFYSLEYHSVFSSELCKDWKPVLKTSGNIFVSANMVKYGEVKQWSNLIPNTCSTKNLYIYFQLHYKSWRFQFAIYLKYNSWLLGQMQKVTMIQLDRTRLS